MKDRTVKLGDYTSDDLHLVFTTLTNTAPEVKTRVIDLPYGNGSLDLTEYYGSVKYGDRLMEMTFFVQHGYDHMAVYSDVCSKLHGKTVTILFSSDPENQYTGRLSVGTFSVNDGKWTFPISATCAPFKVNLSTGEKSL